MPAASPIVIANTPLYEPLAKLAVTQRIVLFAGLPGVGKSLFLQQTALLAHEAGRRVHLLQWDVTRSAFETPPILARYPEVDGVTHAAIRKAVGLWARGAIQRWHTTHAADDLLIGEVPLIGNRLIELVQPHTDIVEALLAGDTTTIVLPVPSREVRQAIEAARAQTTATPQHAKEAGDAMPHILQMLWQELYSVAQRLQLAGASTDPTAPHPYDPAIYAAVYHHLLQHRRCETLSVAQVLPKVSSVYDLPIPVQELAATAAEVAEQLTFIERSYESTQLQEAVARWYDFP
ncbi:MAG TPA: hypothetical protein P5121_21545 [Caldilineaceae bacterium]|nr:hypothetical protein [Caldilineaceae bacterium]